MTVKSLLNSLDIKRNQHVKITDERKYRTYISEDGCFAFERYEDGPFTIWEYISKLTVTRFSFDDSEIHIYAK